MWRSVAATGSVAATAAFLLAVSACGGKATGVPKIGIDRDLHDEGIALLVDATKSGDARAIEALFDDPLVFGGMWFEDTTCRRQLAAAGTVVAAGLPALARCLATIQLERSTRTSPVPDIAVLTYGPGIEIEVRFRRARGVKIQWIGYVSRRHARDALPTVTQGSLEALRAEPLATSVTEPIKQQLDVELARLAPTKVLAWLKVCLDSRGAVTGVYPRMTTSAPVQAAFETAARTWKFQPVMLGGQPSPVCSLMHVDYPAGSTDSVLFPVPVPDEYADAVVVPRSVLGRPIGGLRGIRPDGRVRDRLNQLPNSPVVGIYLVCVEGTGKTVMAWIARSIGVAEFDQALRAMLLGWRYKPFASPGQPTISCGYVRYQFFGKGSPHMEWNERYR